MSEALIVLLCGVGGVIVGIPFAVGCIVLYAGIQDEIEFLRSDLDAWLTAQREAPSAVQENQAFASRAASGTSGSPSPASGTRVQLESGIGPELRPRLPRGGTKRTEKRTSSLHLVK
jgi:hypothetical protein